MGTLLSLGVRIAFVGFALALDCPFSDLILEDLIKSTCPMGQIDFFPEYYSTIFP